MFLPRGSCTRSMLVLAALSAAAVSGCQRSVANRSLIFFTGTTMGVEVAVNPSDATGPMRLVVGYKRAEGVLDPVYDPEGVEAAAKKKTTKTEKAEPSNQISVSTRTADTVYRPLSRDLGDTDHSSGGTAAAVPITITETEEPVPDKNGAIAPTKRYLPEAYSVIAKFSGEGGAGVNSRADAKLSIAQWFATGHAADLLANAPGIAGAVTGNAEIAKEAAKQRALGRGLEGLNLTHAMALLQAVGNGLNTLANPTDGSPPDPIAKKHVEALAAASRAMVPAIWLHYQWSNKANKELESIADTATPTLVGLGAYIAALDSSTKLLDGAVTDAGLKYRSFKAAAGAAFDPAGPGTAINDNLKTELASAQIMLKSVREQLAKDQRCLDAVDYYLSVVTSSK